MRLERKGESVFGQEKRSRPRCWEYALPCRLEGVDVSFPMLVNLPSGGPGVIGTEELPDERTKMLRTILRLAEDKELPTRAVWVGPKAPGRRKGSFGVEFAATFEEAERKLGRFFPSYLER